MDDLLDLFSEDLAMNSEAHLLAANLSEVNARDLVQECADVRDRLARYRPDRRGQA